MYLHELVFEISKDERFKDKAIQFATAQIAYEIIHILTAKKYGEIFPKSIPDKSKFKLKIA